MQQILDLRDYTTLLSLCVGIASFVAVFLIYTRQSGAGEKLKTLVEDVKTLVEGVEKRLFGTIEGFDSLYHRATEILDKANNSPHSEMGIMLYWLWFGADIALHKHSYKLAALKPNHSEIRRRLAIRREKGLCTTVVLLDPKGPKMRDFLKALCSWQRSKEGEQAGSVTTIIPSHASLPEASQSEVEDEDLNTCIENYKKDVIEFFKQVRNTPDTHFKELARKDAVPMIMFALKIEGGGSCCLVCLNEIETLSSRAPVGGFYSEDSKIVDIVYGQIKRIAEQ